MFLLECVECYDETEHGPIVEIQREDGTGPMDDPDEVEVCGKCGKTKHYVLTSNQAGIRDGDYYHISESLAINPSQTKVHRKLFPGVDVLSDGRIGFNSVKKQSDYLKKTGFNKHTQKIKKKGVRIA
jgi:hypothetical protein